MTFSNYCGVRNVSLNGRNVLDTARIDEDKLPLIPNDVDIIVR